MSPTVEHVEVLFTILLGIALGVSGTSFGEALRDRRAIRELAPENDRANLNVSRALRNEALRLAMFIAFLASAIRGLYLPKEAFPRGQQYVAALFILVVLAKIAGTALDRRDRVREMQPIYKDREVKETNQRRRSSDV